MSFAKQEGVRKWTSQAGISAIELLTVVGIIGIAGAIALPSTQRPLSGLRIGGDARAIHNMVGLAKMRAAARFTRERLFVDLGTETFFLQYWDKAANAWVTEGGAATLSTGVNFGFAGVAAPPPNTQAALAQAPACLDNGGGAIPNTACVVFNSRGIPIDPATGDPEGNTAFYVSDGVTVYGVTLSATPLIRLWWSPAHSAHWVHK